MAKTKKTNNTEKTFLEVEPRTVIGKKVKRLRQDGFIPATVYGPGFTSKSIQVKIKDFLRVYKIAHETGIVFLNLDKQELPTLIKNLQRHPLNDIILHADFRKIDLKEKMETEVPVLIVGESEAIAKKGGVLLTQAENIMIEALPQNIPQAIEIDVSKMTEIGQEIKVSDLSKSELYEIKEDPDKVIVSIVAHKEESITPETTAPVTEVTTEKPVEGEEEVPAEEEKKEEKKEEVKKEEKK